MKMAKSSAITTSITLILTWLVACAAYGTESSIESEGNCRIEGDRSPNLARRIALEEAKLGALRYTPEEILSIKSALLQETPAEVTDTYFSRTTSRNRGRILSYEIVTDTQIVLVHYIKIKARIYIDDGSQQSPYRIESIELNSAIGYERGDELRVEFDLSRQSLLYIFNILPDGKVGILFPSIPDLFDNKTEPIDHGRHSFPPAGNDAIEIFPLDEYSHYFEEIRIVATDPTAPIVFNPSDIKSISYGEGYEPYYYISQETMEREIIHVPYLKRGEAAVVYKVFNAGEESR